MKKILIKAPASTANLGPGFDSLGLALDLWNQAEFSINGNDLDISVQGEGKGEIPLGKDNIIYRAFEYTYNHLGKPLPQGLAIKCKNKIPLSSGLGSSASASLLGILGAKALLNADLSDEKIIQLGTDLEGHPDNFAASLLGGLTISLKTEEEIITKKINVFPWKITVVMPDIDLSTESSRNILPNIVGLSDTVHNIGSSLLLVQALQYGDFSLLKKSIVDRIHQPHRLSLLPGAKEAISIAQQIGVAVALSGAGPSLVAFSEHRSKEIQECIMKEFQDAGFASRLFELDIENDGAKTE